MKSLRIATRNSPLALWQANYVKQQLFDSHPELIVKIVSMTTKGDQMLDRKLSTAGGKGLFLKELEVSLLNKETDIAVHSMKDVPISLPSGLEIAAVCKREDPRDAFVSNHYQNLYALPKGARVGTSSLRRVAQLKKAFPTLEFIELRGNVNTRLAKLDDDYYDAIILAAAGLIRLGFSERIKQYISPDICLPAVGQGVIGIECRSDDSTTKALLEPLHSQVSALSIAAERAMNAALEGGCQVPVAGFAEVDKGKIHMRGMVGKVDGSECLTTELTIKDMNVESATELGDNVAKDLLKQGAGAILSALYNEPFELTKLEDPVVILTRSEQFLGNTSSLLESLGYQPLLITAMKIKPMITDEILEMFSNIHEYTDVLFVSRNAVEIAMPVIGQQGGVLDDTRVMAVGSETAKQLYKHGIDALFPDRGNGVEALLRVQQLKKLKDRKVLIIRGTRGNDRVVKKMHKRGAEVTVAECYQQLEPDTLSDQVGELFSSDIHHRVKGIFIHSAHCAINILPYINRHHAKIRESKLIVGSESIAETAREYGWDNEIRVAESPSNKHMMIAFSG